MIVSVDTYRQFFETQGRKHGRNLSWSCDYPIIQFYPRHCHYAQLFIDN